MKWLTIKPLPWPLIFPSIFSIQDCRGNEAATKHQRQAQEKPSQNSDLSIYSAGDLEMIANIHNPKPRKALNWRTPAEVMTNALMSIWGSWYRESA